MKRPWSCSTNSSSFQPLFCYFFCFDFLLSFLYTCRIPIYVQNPSLPESLLWSQDMKLSFMSLYISYLYTAELLISDSFVYIFIFATRLQVIESIIYHIDTPKSNYLFYTFRYCHSEYSFLFYLFIYLFIYLFMAVLGLRFCARAFSSCGKWGALFIAVCGPLTIAASLVAEHRLQTRRLSSCGSRA